MRHLDQQETAHQLEKQDWLISEIKQIYAEAVFVLYHIL